MTASHSSGVMLTSIRSRRIPALLTSTSSRPKVSMAVLTSRWAPSQSETSSPLATASPPMVRISSTTSPAGPVEPPVPSTSAPRSLTTTLAPWRANSMAWPRPMPRPAPVTITDPSFADACHSASSIFGRHDRWLASVLDCPHQWKSASTGLDPPGPVDRAGRRRGQAAHAADPRPGQAGGPLRRPLPPDRLRAVQPGQRRLPEDRGPHPVQEPQPRRAHLPDLAHVDAARQLRLAGAGPDAAGPAVVRGLGRRHLPEPQHRRRRAARLHLRVRRRPHLPHGSPPDARAAPRHRGRRHRGRHPGARGPGRPVRRDRARARAPPIRSFQEKPAVAVRPARRPRPGLRVDGQLHLHAPTCCSTPCTPTPPTPTPATTWAATWSRCWSTPAWPTSTTSPTTRCRGRPTGTGGTGGTWERSTATTRPTWTWSRSIRCSTSTTGEWPIYTAAPQLPPAKFVFEERGPDRPGHRLDGQCRRHHLGRHRPPLGPLARRAGRTRAPWSRTRSSWTTSSSAAARSCAGPSSTRTSRCPPAPASASTQELDRPAVHGLGQGRGRDRQGQRSSP